MSQPRSKGSDRNSGDGSDKDGGPFSCALCGKLLNEPRVIPCGHIFCTTCLGKHIEKFAGSSKSKSQDGGGGEGGEDQGGEQAGQDEGAGQSCSVTCPVSACSYIFEVFSGDPQQFHKSFILEKLVQLERLRQMDIRCSVCSKTAAKPENAPGAQKFCKECSDWYCIDCSLKHTKTMKTKDHHVAEASEGYRQMGSSRTRETKCPEHPDKVNNKYCGFCQKLICEMCYMSKHRGHQEVIELDKLQRRLANRLSQQQREVRSRRETSERFREKLEGARDKTDTASRRVGDEVDALCDEIKEHVERIRERAKKIVDEKISDLGETNGLHRSKIEDRVALLKRFETCLGRIAEDATPSELFFATRDADEYLALVDQAPYSSKGTLPTVQTLSDNRLQDRLKQLAEGSRGLLTLIDPQFASELEKEKDGEENGKNARSARSVRSEVEIGGSNDQLVGSAPFKPETASMASCWFSTRSRYDSNKVQIRSTCFRESRRTFLVADIWNKCIKEFSENGEFQRFWETERGFPLAIAEMRISAGQTPPLAIIEYDIGLKQSHICFYSAQSKLLRSMQIPIPGLYIGSICVTNENLVAVPSHDSRYIHLFTQSGLDPRTYDRHRVYCLDEELERVGKRLRVPGRPEFLAYSKTDSHLLISCPQDRVIFITALRSEVKQSAESEGSGSSRPKSASLVKAGDRDEGGLQILREIRASALGVPSWRPYCVATSVRDGRFIVQDGLHPDQDQLLLFSPGGDLVRVMPQDRVWIRVGVDSGNRLILNDKEQVAVYTCQWMNERLRARKDEKVEGEGEDDDKGTQGQGQSEREQEERRNAAGTRCETHNTKQIELYCKDCNALLCQQCMIMDHRNHRFEDLIKSARGEGGSMSSSRNGFGDRQSASSSGGQGQGQGREENGFLTNYGASSSGAGASGAKNDGSKGMNNTSQANGGGYQPGSYLSSFTKGGAKGQNRERDSPLLDFNDTTTDGTKLQVERVMITDKLAEVAIEFEVMTGREIRRYGPGTPVPIKGRQPAAGVALSNGGVLLIERISEIESLACFYANGRFDHSINFMPKTALNPSSIAIAPNGNVLVPAGADKFLYVYDSGCAMLLQKLELDGNAEYVACSGASGLVALSVPDEGLVVVLSSVGGQYAPLGRVRPYNLGANMTEWVPKALAFSSPAPGATDSAQLSLLVFEENSHRLLEFAVKPRDQNLALLGVRAENVDNCEQLLIEANGQAAFCASHTGVRRVPLFAQAKPI